MCGFLEVQRLIRGYSLFNPHMSIKFRWFGELVDDLVATNPNWSKWKPNRPTNPHWYAIRHLERLIGSYIAKDRDDETDRTVASFVAEFDGLAGTRKRKAVIDQAGLARRNLSDLANNDGFNGDLLTGLCVTGSTRDILPRRSRNAKSCRRTSSHGSSQRIGNHVAYRVA